MARQDTVGTHRTQIERHGMEIDRSRLNTCLAKAIAYQQVDKPEDAEAWARELIKELKLVNILK